MTNDEDRLVRHCFEAFRAADRDAMEAVLHSDFTFNSPRDDRIDRAAYFARCWPGAGTFAALDLLAIVGDGTGGCFVLYAGRSRAGAGFRNVERMTFRDGRIVATEVFFGREPG
ncbi:nuclear transport factor 2 family protein [Chelatococcus reniformis]|uniref:SnoaL-like domain-containing protein n=1 Tax=Chelatococcus reniformis TaxID=1494448 RepID=A0A916TWM8_9HYPH|nr:nuclear transport factor 2 family protein [Chelatococcus reniformis]GGC45153.1 hypothetical protein GCM10010994_00360 [Chelatococcus reniformis]